MIVIGKSNWQNHKFEAKSSLIAEVISIGDELTSGNRLDTNSQWISRHLSDLGVVPSFHTTVGDRLTDNVAVFRTAAQRANIIISSGGLGPTADDLTREAVASAFDRPLEFRAEAFEHISSLFAQRQRPMPERNRVQALLPSGARIIPNPHGTAPGIDLTIPGSMNPCRLFCLPGVPAEMRQMYEQTVAPALINEIGVGKLRWYYRSLKLFGIGESDVERELPDLIARDRDPVVGITVSKATITLRIGALCASEEEFRVKIESTEKLIYDKLGELIFGVGEVELDEAVADVLQHKAISLGVIEVGAGAWVAPSLAKHFRYGQRGGLRNAKWLPSLPDMGPAEEQLERLAEELMNLDPTLNACLAVGVYPTLEEVVSAQIMPSTQFEMVFVHGAQAPKKKSLTVGAHPDVLYPRLSKTALNFLRMELSANA